MLPATGSLPRSPTDLGEGGPETARSRGLVVLFAHGINPERKESCLRRLPSETPFVGKQRGV